MTKGEKAMSAFCLIVIVGTIVLDVFLVGWLGASIVALGCLLFTAFLMWIAKKGGTK